MTRVLLVSSYEQGRQPLGLASPAAALRAAAHEVDTLDLSLDPPDADTIRAVDLIALSVPMHTAARLALRLAERLRGLVPGTPLVLYGLYASEMDGQAQVGGLIDAVVGGEYEGPLVALAEAVAGGGPLPAAPGGQFDAVPGAGPQPLFPREAMPLPDRTGLPSLDRYARASVLDREGRPQERLTGYVEASRGCAHRCATAPSPRPTPAACASSRPNSFSPTSTHRSSSAPSTSPSATPTSSTPSPTAPSSCACCAAATRT